MSDVFTSKVNPRITNVAHSSDKLVSQRVIVDVLYLVDIVRLSLLLMIPVEEANEEIVRQILLHFIKGFAIMMIHLVLAIF